MNKLAQEIENAFNKLNEPIEETNVTGALDGGDGPINTPNAFSKSQDEDSLDNDHIEVLGYKKIDAKKKKYFTKESLFKKIANQINEISYAEYKQDSSLTSKQKVNSSIKEINSRLFQLERFFKQNKKLKEEDALDRTHYWKSTAHKICKIHERLGNITKLLEDFGASDIILEIETRQKMIDFIVACNTESQPKDHWKEEHLKSLGDDKLKILVRNRIKSLPGLSQTYNAKKLL